MNLLRCLHRYVEQRSGAAPCITTRSATLGLQNSRWIWTRAKSLTARLCSS